MRSETLCKTVEMHILETGKFKDVILSFRFFNELKTPDSWVRTVLALMLADRGEKYPTKREVSCCLAVSYTHLSWRKIQLTAMSSLNFWKSSSR